MTDEKPEFEIAAGAPLMMGLIWLLIVGLPVQPLAGDTSDISKISVQQLKDLLGRPDTVVVDVRTDRDWWRSSRKIPGALREDPSKVDQWMGEYFKNQTLIFYCS